MIEKPPSSFRVGAAPDGETVRLFPQGSVVYSHRMTVASDTYVSLCSTTRTSISSVPPRISA